MKEFANKQEAFASQNFDPSKVEVTGVPEQHVEAVKAFINLCVVHDAVNPEFNPDFSDYSQDKYNAVHEMGSPSGSGFSYGGYYYWLTLSYVGSRLCSESRKATRHIAEICHEDYKAMKVYDRQIK
ncbi:hypothetical protein HX004_14170 [Myroides sp. 1354]|uniref:hypothetical protein n=1 Tax=unclassified Myroides TaxID=2642485 RepID=UPI0025773045|nr:MULTISPECIES: hypothetical protein [unclassified Myroides]MDM1045901.1 hypothetical protein [Myroides sp. R163-1]MDM1056911.1 hypothetical protein [Myroides sp. 1354]MDM1070106.1 hypothetical protein [Myroides sp. 1372]